MEHQQTDPLPKGPVDPDVDLHIDRRASRTRDIAILTVVALGGGIGASARYGAGLIWPTEPGSFPWTTLFINIVGCALIGILMVLVTDVLTQQRLVRPFLGTGVLGGFTTFSTYALDIQKLVAEREAATALLYLATTLAAAVLAVWSAVNVTRSLISWRTR